MKKNFGTFGAGQFSLETLVGGRPGTTIFQNLGGGGGAGGGSHTRTRPGSPPPPRARNAPIDAHAFFVHPALKPPRKDNCGLEADNTAKKDRIIPLFIFAHLID